jgi:uncharacterized protein YwgA
MKDEILIAFVLKKFGEKGSKRTRLSKLLSKIKSYSFEYNPEKPPFIWYNYGPHQPALEQSIINLTQLGIVREEKEDEKEKGRLILTEKGIELVDSLINQDIFSSDVTHILEESLFVRLEKLIEDTLRQAKGFNFEKIKFVDYTFTKVFDWSNFGNGEIKPYHHSLLLSHGRIEEKYKREIIRGGNIGMPNVFYNKIPERLDLFQLKRPEKNKNKSLLNVFNKKMPINTRENKTEGKNYILNRWYIVEAINIIHILDSLAPTLRDISIMCLTECFLFTKRIIYEKLIKNDLTELEKQDIIYSFKENGKKFYALRAKIFYDNIIDKEFSVLEENKVINIYNKLYSPLQRSRFGFEILSALNI